MHRSTGVGCCGTAEDLRLATFQTTTSVTTSDTEEMEELFTTQILEEQPPENVRLSSARREREVLFDLRLIRI